MLEYFDVFQIGLTVTPDNRTFGYFNQNLVCNYSYEKAVIEGVLVPLLLRLYIVYFGKRRIQIHI